MMTGSLSVSTKRKEDEIIKIVESKRDYIFNRIFKMEMDNICDYGSSESLFENIRNIFVEDVEDSDVFGEIMVRIIHLSGGTIEKNFSLKSIYLERISSNMEPGNLDSGKRSLRFVHRFGAKGISLFFETEMTHCFDIHCIPYVSNILNPDMHCFFPIPLKYTDSRSITEIPDEILEFYGGVKKWLRITEYPNKFKFKLNSDVELYLNLR